MKKYVFGLNPNGQVKIGTILEYPDEYTIEGSEDVWNTQNRAFYVDGAWTIYDPLALVAAPSSAVVNQVFNVIAQLPENSPDTVVNFSVQHDLEVLQDNLSVTVVDGQVSQAFSFDTDGAYKIIISSEHHGTIVAEVTINA